MPPTNGISATVRRGHVPLVLHAVHRYFIRKNFALDRSLIRPITMLFPLEAVLTNKQSEIQQLHCKGRIARYLRPACELDALSSFEDCLIAICLVGFLHLEIAD